MNTLTKQPEWQALAIHQQQMQSQTLRQLFANNPNRFTHFSKSLDELLFDFSKHLIDEKILQQLLQLAKNCHLEQKIKQLFAGEKLNFTDQRPALHMALRDDIKNPFITGADQSQLQEINAALERMQQWISAIRSHRWHGFDGKLMTDVIHIGVGGSDLGVRLVVNALRSYTSTGLSVHFVSALDGQQIVPLMEKLNPATTLVVITSKTFTTQDTLANAKTIRDWFQQKTTNPTAWQHHFIGISANAKQMTAFGILPSHQLLFWDWVGGRYSIWSSAGFVAALAIGFENFKALLAGARLADQHFLRTPLPDNIPVLMALLSIWYNNFWHCSSQVILPYTDMLDHLPAYLQQLEMESLGKSITQTAAAVDYQTGQIIWGDAGPQAQHAFYQLLHQGTRLIPADFIVPIAPDHDLPHYRHLTLANALAQSRALMLGINQTEAQQSLIARGIPSERATQLAPFYCCPGNRPSSTFIFPQLTPNILGMLLAFYEHKVFVQSVIWNINPFDQCGVELGKNFATELLTLLNENGHIEKYDQSTQGLLQYIEKTLHSHKK